jgi:sterol desaturase/sphingolipid hydroxylase (fatty acid hydroxylase superfamily)
VLPDVARKVVLILAVGAPFFAFERRFAAHPIRYRRVLARDLAAFAVVVLLGVPAGAVASALLVPFVDLLRRAPALPRWASIPAAIVGSDLAVYWLHRLLHTRPFWRAHRWHHAPRHMYWLAGVRTSVAQGLLYGMVPLLFVGLGVPAEVAGAYGLLTVVANHWMHANLRLRCRWLEAVLVTPRYHHIHHSRDPRHHDRNFGALLSVWDRVFGTYLDPDLVTAPIEFGIPETVSPGRLVVGV